MTAKKPEDGHRLDRPPRDYREDPRGQEAGSYSGSSGDSQPGPGDYGGARGTDYGDSSPSGSAAEQAADPLSAPDPALMDQLGAGPRERPAHGARGEADFGRAGRSVNAPPSEGPLGELWEQSPETKDSHS